MTVNIVCFFVRKEFRLMLIDADWCWLMLVDSLNQSASDSININQHRILSSVLNMYANTHRFSSWWTMAQAHCHWLMLIDTGWCWCCDPRGLSQGWWVIVNEPWVMSSEWWMMGYEWWVMSDEWWALRDHSGKMLDCTHVSWLYLIKLESHSSPGVKDKRTE